MMKKIISALSIVAVIFGTIGYSPLTATAAQLTGVKDTLSTVATSATATHVITATLVGANTFAAGESIIYDFADSDFTISTVSGWATSDFSFNDGSGRTIIAVSSTSGVAPTCTAGTPNVAVTINSTTNTFTVVACSTYTPSAAAAAITFTINGTSPNGTMTNKATDVDSSTFSITETTDSASGAVVAETNGVVTVTASVAATLTFSNTQNAVDFGPLTSGAARYATAGAASGGSASAATNGHLLSVGTNATAGYTVTYVSPNTLTSGSNTIAPSGTTITTTAGGTPGTAQFAIGAASSSGSPTIPAAYDAASSSYKTITYGTVDTLFSRTVPATDAANVRYIANIPATQPAGNYSTTFTYVATGNF